jgi:hypothetical protein
LCENTQRRSWLIVPGFLSPFDIPAFASWVIVPPLRSWAFLTVGLPAHRAGPQRDCHVAHEQDTTGQDASFTPGTVVRSRPATTLRPAPAAFQRPVPTAPLLLPIGGGHCHETSAEVHSRSPITPAASPPPGPGSKLPAGLLLACSPRMERGPLGFFPELRTPRLPTTHVEAETGHHALARVLHLRHQPNLQTVPPTELMHPHAAHSHRWPPSPPR